MGGLEAFKEPCRAGLAAEAEKCTPKVTKNAQFGGNLEAKLKPKSTKKSIKIGSKFLFFFEALLEAKTVPKSLQNGTQDRLEDAFQRARKLKWRKCDFEQHYNVLARFLVSWGLGNRRNI